MPGSRTRVEEMYEALRADVLGGRRRPGERLLFAELCDTYGSSMGVLREALTRLAAEGLVQSEPQHGFRVRSISMDDLEDLTDARCEIEVLVLRRAVKDGDLDWETTVLAAHHRLERAVSAPRDDGSASNEVYAVAHANFHNALLEGCRNRRLRATAEALRDAAELYRRWSVPRDDVAGRDIPAEHREILAAVLDRKADAAADALLRHIRYTTRVLDERI